MLKGGRRTFNLCSNIGVSWKADFGSLTCTAILVCAEHTKARGHWRVCTSVGLEELKNAPPPCLHQSWTCDGCFHWITTAVCWPLKYAPMLCLVWWHFSRKHKFKSLSVGSLPLGGVQTPKLPIPLWCVNQVVVGGGGRGSYQLPKCITHTHIHMCTRTHIHTYTHTNRARTLRAMFIWTILKSTSFTARRQMTRQQTYNSRHGSSKYRCSNIYIKDARSKL